MGRMVQQIVVHGSLSLSHSPPAVPSKNVTVPPLQCGIYPRETTAQLADLHLAGGLRVHTLGRGGPYGLSSSEPEQARWQPQRSDLAIKLVLMLRLMFHLALRQAKAFTSSVLHLLGLALTMPDHAMLNRRGRAFAERQPRVLASIA